ncbi:unnamed protein product [Rhizoctonia solani]|uniref:Uncharacterized protein n=1 Tax=Rhizoctonia solani TaxID=456999 RepID=A0A8H3DKU3_9AGAM|nr:unnamed protein product [Rhizoctonia solani]
MDILFVRPGSRDDWDHRYVPVEDTNWVKRALECVFGSLDSPTSAAPPLILMVIGIIDGYLIKGSPNPAFIIAVDITGKFFLLSVMINLCGRNLVQEEFNLSAGAKPRPSLMRNQAGLSINPISVMIQQEKFTEYELNEWPLTSNSAKADIGHERFEIHPEETATNHSGDETVVDLERGKQTSLTISEEQWLSNEQRLNRQA